MIEQCLSNKNESATISNSKNFLYLNKPQIDRPRTWKKNTGDTVDKYGARRIKHRIKHRGHRDPKQLVESESWRCDLHRQIEDQINLCISINININH